MYRYYESNQINFLERIDLILPNLHDFQFSVYVDVISLGTLMLYKNDKIT